MKRIRFICSLCILLFAMKAAPLIAGPFLQGSQTVSIIAGAGSAFGDDYIILGGGYGYYVIDGLELGIDAQFWLSGDPSITKLSPQIRYVFTQPKTVKPYVGAFFRRTFIEDLDDLDSTGLRAGLNFMGRGNFYFGLGFVHETYRDCAETVYTDCSDTYPEILFGFSM